MLLRIRVAFLKLSKRRLSSKKSKLFLSSLAVQKYLYRLLKKKRTINTSQVHLSRVLHPQVNSTKLLYHLLSKLFLLATPISTYLSKLLKSTLVKNLKDRSSCSTTTSQSNSNNRNRNLRRNEKMKRKNKIRKPLELY